MRQQTRPLHGRALADLQAGLLDDEAAARVRRQVRATRKPKGRCVRCTRLRHGCRRPRRGPRRRLPRARRGHRPGSRRRCVGRPRRADRQRFRHTRPDRTSVRPGFLRGLPGSARCWPGRLRHGRTPESHRHPRRAPHLPPSTHGLDPPMVIPLSQANSSACSTTIRLRPTRRPGTPWRPASAVSVIPRPRRYWVGAG